LEEEIYMPEAGGSAAIYGILYQILANLWRVSEIRLKAKLAGQEIQSALLILEPKWGGGDARYEGDGIRVVEQYKTRSGNRTWSLKDLIEDVLPNLFVDLERFSPQRRAESHLQALSLLLSGPHPALCRRERENRSSPACWDKSIPFCNRWALW
jgi:hypothetical protein